MPIKWGLRMSVSYPHQTVADSPPVPASTGRLRARLAWEAVLALLVVALFLVLWRVNDNLPMHTWPTVVVLGTFAMAFSVSLRAGVPNLAVTAIGYAAAAMYIHAAAHDTNVAVTVAIALGGALLVGALLGLVTAVTSAPAWAVSLGGLALVQFASRQYLVPRASDDRVPEPLDGIVLNAIAVGVLLVSVVGGVVWWRLKRDRTPAHSSGPSPAQALFGFTTSSGLAAVAGILATRTGSGAMADGGAPLLLLVLGTVLLGGVSVAGGRGALAGTALAVLAAVVAGQLTQELWSGWLFGPESQLLVGGVAILVGTGVGALLARARRPTDMAPDQAPVPDQPAWSGPAGPADLSPGSAR
jgi:ribose/xylose/arabinose/galactoside ABC-type transport system permease subunit